MIAATLTPEDTMRLDDPRVFDLRTAETGLDTGWFRELQAAAWRRHRELPLPTRLDERWRFASLRTLGDIGGYTPAPFQAPDRARWEALAGLLPDTAGSMVFVDDCVAVHRLDPEVAARGVVFTTLVDAMLRHPDLLRSYFMRHSPELGSEKFEALHLALLRNGLFLHVPDGVEVRRPFAVWHQAEHDGGAIFPHSLFITGANSRAELFEFQGCANPASRHLAIANAHLFAGDGSDLRHTIVQDWNRNTVSFQLNTSNAGRATNAKSILINTGSAIARQEVHGRIFGSGSNVELYSLSVARGDQEYDQRTLQTHIAPHSRSDLLFKNALLDQSRTIFSGLIVVEEDAQQTDAYQTNNNLMLSEEAESNSLPGLEIKANDVKCSHGATTGRIDETELFYFLSRGIPRHKAQELMVFGYFEEIIGKFTSPVVADFVRERVQHKFID
jgi:Fe-S cluster assembly protein SufD